MSCEAATLAWMYMIYNDYIWINSIYIFFFVCNIQACNVCRRRSYGAWVCSRACVRVREGGVSRGPVAMCSGCKTWVPPGAPLLARLPRVGRVAPPPPAPFDYPHSSRCLFSYLSSFSFVIIVRFSPYRSRPPPPAPGWKSSVSFLSLRSFSSYTSF